MAENDALPPVDHTVYGRIGEALWSHPFEYDAHDLAATLADYETSAPHSRVTLLSAEGLVGTPWRGGVDGPERLRRICEQFDGVKILVIIRNQIDLLESFYKQYLLAGGTCTPDVLYGPPSLHVDFRLGFLDYYNLADFCARLFGRDRLCLLPYELIRAEGHQAFCDRICDFMHLPRLVLQDSDTQMVRQGYDANLAHHARYANFFLRSFFSPCGPLSMSSLLGRVVWGTARAAAGVERALGRERPILTPEMVDEMTERFRPGNRLLRDYCGADIAAFGYPL